MLKKTLSLFLSLLLCASGCITAFADDNKGTISGDVDIVNPVFQVALPLNLDFSLDPLKLKGQNQIFSGDASYNIVNKTEIPIKVDFALNITATNTATGGVTFVNAANTPTKNLPDGTPVDKKIYLAVQGAKSIDATKTRDSKGIPVSTPVSKDTAANQVVAAYATGGVTKDEDAAEFDIITTPGSAQGIFSFLVDKGTLVDPDDVSKNTPTETSIASFRLYASLATYAEWDATDFTFEGSYSFIGVAEEDYVDATITQKTTYMQSGVPALMKNVGTYSALATPLTFSSGAGFIKADNSDTETDLTLSGIKAGPVTVPFFYDGKQLDSVSMGGSAWPTTAYTVGNNKISFTNLSAGTKVITIKLKETSGTSSYVLTITTVA